MLLNGLCQQTTQVNIALVVDFNNNSIVLQDSVYPLQNGNIIRFETLKFYLSNVQLFQNDAPVFTEQNSFHLIDISDPITQNISIELTDKIDFNKIKFNLGVDSITNVSGAMGGDLDPTKGMYWAWQSGYINFKMEGSCSTCLPPNTDLEFHLGGYIYPFSSFQNIELNTNAKSNFKIILDISQFFKKVDLTRQNHIMSPCGDAVILSQHLSKCFRVK